MARINPHILKRQRHTLGLSMDDLETKSGITKATIYRIEAGKSGRSTGNTIELLARHLKMTPEELTAAKADDGDSQDETLFNRSQMNIRISNEARNALALVAARYRVRPAEIIEFAPFLFFLAAEESLQARRDHLTELQQRRAAIQELSGCFPHITERLLNDWQAEEMEYAEEQSIADLDLRGQLLDDADQSYDIRQMDYDENEQNPFVAHLKARMTAIAPDQESNQFDRWYEYWGPRYTICKKEALDYFGGDTEIAEEFLLGSFSMHEIPKELRSAEAAVARLEWTRKTVTEKREQQVGLLERIGFADLVKSPETDDD